MSSELVRQLFSLIPGTTPCPTAAEDFVVVDELPTPEVADAEWNDWLIATQPGELRELPAASSQAAAALKK